MTILRSGEGGWYRLCRCWPIEARIDSFFAFEARPTRAFWVFVVLLKMLVYAAMSTAGGGSNWTGG